MPDLFERLTGDAQKKRAVVDDCVAMIDQEVDDKGGLTGLAVKGAYKVVKGIKPGFVPQVVEHLLPEFAARLDPIWTEALAEGDAPSRFLVRHSGRVADALLSVTDERARRATGVVKSTYDRLRPTAKRHVEDAVPRLGRLLEKHAR